MPSSPPPKKLKRIVVLGSLNADLVTLTPRIPRAGETLTATSFTTGPGGKGANQAVACARSSRSRPTPNPSSNSESHHDEESGEQTSSSASKWKWKSKDAGEIEVIFLGAVGRDAHGTLLVNTLSSNAISTSSILLLPDTSTGTATILVESRSGENRILYVPGANGLVTPPLLSSPSWSRALWGTDKPDLLVLQLEVPLETVLATVRKAREEGVEVLLNPAPIPEAWGREEVRGLLGGLGHLVVNEGEAGGLVSAAGAGAGAGGAAPGEKRMGVGEGEGDTGSDDWLERVFSVLKGMGVRHVVVTLGERGAAYSLASVTAEGGRVREGSGQEGGEGRNGFERVKAGRVERVVDTTAAGDTFVGAYAVEVVRGLKGGGFDIGRAVERACRAAAKAVEREGAIKAIPWRDEWEEMGEE